MLMMTAGESVSEVRAIAEPWWVTKVLFSGGTKRLQLVTARSD